ncbi:MAG: transporter, partial [Gemmataceae bacterium]|nr:transporter [Gemmataceae bacterium]
GRPVAASPAASLGRPVPLGGVSRGTVRAAAAEDSPFPPPSPILPVAGLAAPTTPAAADLSLLPARPPAIAPSILIPPAPMPSAALPVSERKPHTAFGPPESVPPPSEAGPFPAPDLLPSAETTRPVGPSWWEKPWFQGWGERGSGGKPWCSDGCAPSLISPLTMPFFAEDPRSLTELRPILLAQRLPNVNDNIRGGNAWFFGTQARLAVTERFSIVVHELGFASLNPNGASALRGGSGLAEIKAGAKYTFWRGPDTGTYMAVGGMLEAPVGTARAFQDTGTFSLTPYLSLAQSFGRLPGGFGGLNFMGTAGYSLSVDNKRSQFLYTQLHLDYNVANMNTWFPLIELNYIHYAQPGRERDVGFEGADLFNVGSRTRRGSDYMSVAAGVRYKFSEHVQLGGAVEVPTTREKGLNDYRFTFDVIFRY